MLFLIFHYVQCYEYGNVGVYILAHLLLSTPEEMFMFIYVHAIYNLSGYIKEKEKERKERERNKDFLYKNTLLFIGHFLFCNTLRYNLGHRLKFSVEWHSEPLLLIMDRETPKSIPVW